MPPKLTPHAKAITSALVAVVLAGFTAYQSTVTGRFQLVDAIPVAVAVVAALQTKLIPNLGLSWAKAAINVGSAVVTAIAAVAVDPTNISINKIVIAAVGAFLVWFIPEAAPLIPIVQDAAGKHQAPILAPPVLAPPVRASVSAPVASTTISDVPPAAEAVPSA